MPLSGKIEHMKNTVFLHGYMYQNVLYSCNILKNNKYICSWVIGVNSVLEQYTNNNLNAMVDHLGDIEVNGGGGGSDEF